MAKASSAAAGLMQETDNKPKNEGVSKLRKLAKEGQEAVVKLGRMTGQNERLKENAAGAAEEGACAAITLGTAAGASYAEGYYGPEKLKLGGYDGRTIVGVAGAGYGLVRALQGRKDAPYVVAASTGVLASKLCSTALVAGQEARAKSAAKPASAGGASTGGGTDALTAQVQETPGQKPSGAAGRGPRRTIHQDRDEGSVPPHVARLLRAQNRQTANV